MGRKTPYRRQDEKKVTEKDVGIASLGKMAMWVSIWGEDPEY